MCAAPKPPNEAERLDALWSFELLDTAPEPGFDALAVLAADVCEAPIALVTLVDESRQWFKAQCGLPSPDSTSRDVAFCAYAILQSAIFEVPDAAADPRFADNPLVTGEPFIRFYAGVPLISPDGLALGTLCVIDRVPRMLSERQRAQLTQLAKAVVGLITTRIARSQADRRRLALLDAALAQAAARSEHLRALAALTGALAGARSEHEILTYALTTALRVCPHSRGTIVAAGTPPRAQTAAADEPHGLTVAVPGGAALSLTREPSAEPFTAGEGSLLAVIAGIAGLALNARAAVEPAGVPD